MSRRARFWMALGYLPAVMVAALIFSWLFGAEPRVWYWNYWIPGGIVGVIYALCGINIPLDIWRGFRREV